MSKPKRLDFGGERSGIDVTYVGSKRYLKFGGFYDSIVEIEGGYMPLGAFLDNLGITDEDIHKAREEHKSRQEANP